MSETMAELLRQMDLERLEHNLFRGISRDIVGPRVFGGQVLGQALIAAARTVETEPQRIAHSIHGYFMRPGDMKLPIVYEVDCIRDGGSFTTRRVVAIQKGRAIFSMSASFQVREEGADHQFEMPQVPGPEGLSSDLELWEDIVERVPQRLRHRVLRQRPIEMRPVDPINPLEPHPAPAQQHIWMRARGPVGEDIALHQGVLAFASDFNLLGTALRPHGLSFLQTRLQAASLDHAMWFHRDFRIDEWLLYAMDSPSASNGRGLARGSLFSRDGTLVASVAQEGLMRLRRDVPAGQ